MTQDEFWDIIAKSDKGEDLYKMLNKLSDDELLVINIGGIILMPFLIN